MFWLLISRTYSYSKLSKQHAGLIVSVVKSVWHPAQKED